VTRMLASVRSLTEAKIALDGGADLIDLKEPSLGALGALDHAAVRICVKAIAGHRPVSATIGDLPSMNLDDMTTAVDRMATTGVDYIKIGFFAHANALDCAQALAKLTHRARLVAVIFADEPWRFNITPQDFALAQETDLALLHPGEGTGMREGVRERVRDGVNEIERENLHALIDTLAISGFTGAMLDTAHKTGKTLRDWRTADELHEFITYARNRHLLTGLAGSLRQDDISPLLAFGPDYLGFRGALCSGSNRSQQLDRAAFAKIRNTILFGVRPILYRYS
jgi:(5-formylfuran-3-yl)methyl phosphate synthase